MQGTPKKLKPTRRDYSKVRDRFLGAPTDVIRRTFENTTQYGRIGSRDKVTLYRQLNAPHPALNIPRRNEPVATDTLYSNKIPAIDNGCIAAQYFIGRISNFQSVWPSKGSDGQFAKCLMDEIRAYGAMDVLISDRAKAEISNKVKDILRTLVIKDWQSEPHNKNQNYGEHGWRDAQRMSNNLLNYSGAPPSLWFLALKYVTYVMNHTARQSLNWRTPIEWLLGYTPDITVMLIF